MHTVPSSLSCPSSTRITIRRFARVGALVTSSLFALGVLLQVFLAGAGIFVSSSWWALHATLGMSLGLFPLAFLLLARIGHLGRWSLWLGGLVFGLVALQVVLITIPDTLGLPILSALHPVNALVIFGLAVSLIQRAWQGVRSDRETAGR
jgi:Family of unknown function (DUF6220)